MYVPFDKQKQKRFYGDLHQRFLAWNCDEIEITSEERQELIALFQAHIEALKTCK
mgnify:CR=1 FL=1